LAICAQVLDQVGHAGFVAAADVGQHLQLLCLLVRGPAQVAHRDDRLHRADIVLEAGQPAHVRGGEGPLAGRRDDRDRNEIGRPERGGELRRLLAGSIGRQEGTVVALSDAAERGQELRHREARDQPGRDDDPAEFDGERANSPEYGVDAHRASLLGLIPAPGPGDGDRVALWGAGYLLK